MISTKECKSPKTSGLIDQCLAGSEFGWHLVLGVDVAAELQHSLDDERLVLHGRVHQRRVARHLVAK